MALFTIHTTHNEGAAVLLNGKMASKQEAQRQKDVSMGIIQNKIIHFN